MVQKKCGEKYAKAKESKPAIKNFISDRLKSLRKEHHMSQRELATRLQLLGMDIDKNVITRIETNKRYVTDIELQALAKIFGVFLRSSD